MSAEVLVLMLIEALATNNKTMLVIQLMKYLN